MKEKTKIKIALEENNVRISEFIRSEGIPLRSFQNWCSGERTPAPYLERWIIEKIEEYAKKRVTEE